MKLTIRPWIQKYQQKPMRRDFHGVPPPISVLLKSSRMLPMTEWTNTIPAYGQRIKIGNLSNYRTTHGTTVISSIQLNNGLLITISNPHLGSLKSKLCTLAPIAEPKFTGRDASETSFNFFRIFPTTQNGLLGTMKNSLSPIAKEMIQFH